MNKYYKYILQELESVRDKKIVFWGASVFLKEFFKKTQNR